MKKLTADDPETKSVDMTVDNLDALQRLFPDAFVEGKVDFDVLKQLLGGAVDERDEKYGLNWHGKRAARQMALTPSTGTLRPCPEESVDWDTTQNVMIEGDNLEVLKLLQKSYSGRVKLIFIDPPYNTGNDFVYPDDFRDGVDNYLQLTGQRSGDGRSLTSNPEASGRFHTTWLNMVYPRLKLAHSLLASDGFLVISIDDSEVGDLRLVCDEIFGADSFVANVVWQKKYTRANDATFFSTTHDHLLFYARDKAEARLGRVARGEAQTRAYSNPDGHPKGPWKATPLHARSGSNTSSYVFENGVTWAPPTGTYRRFSDESMRALEQDDAIWFGASGSSTPSRKSFLSELDDGMVPVTIWDHEFAGHNHQANDELKALGMAGCFSSPKPTKLMGRILELTTTGADGEIALDFFVGSGTFGEAVTRQNLADGGNRRYLAVQLPEQLDPKNKDQRVAAEFCESIGVALTIAELTKERLRRSGKAVKASEGGAEVDAGFRVFKLDSSNIEAWEPVRTDLESSLTDAIVHLRGDRSEGDILAELLLKLGLELTVPIAEREIANKTVYSVGSGTLLVCLATAMDHADIEAIGIGIVAWHDELDPAGESTVVFRDSAFADDVGKTNLTAILEQHGLTTVRSL
jgi:adenine-specific DNA-methyltransferase